MEHLPPGWRVSNNAGSFSGPPPIEDKDIDSDSENSDDMNFKPDSPGWEDVDAADDVEQVNIKCLICPSVFDSAKSMLEHSTIDHGLDFLAIIKQFKLDFYGTIKLVNYIRSTTSAKGDGTDLPGVSDPSLWADDRYLQPVLEDDALLFCLDDFIDFGETENESHGQINGDKMEE